MEGKIIYFDVSAVLIMTIMLTVIFFKRMIRGDINRYFLMLLCFSILTTGFDIWAVMLDNGALKGGPAIITTAHTLYLLFHNTVTPVFIMYCMALTDSRFVGKTKKIKWTLFWMPFVSITVLLILNNYNHAIFYLNNNTTYTRGPWFYMLYVSAAIYALYGMIKVLETWSAFDLGRWIALFSGMAFMLIATVVQYFIPELLVEMLASALALVFILFMVQRPEEMIDAETGLQSRQAFLSIMRYNERRGRHKKMILLALTNYRWIHTHLTYEQEHILTHGQADLLSDYLATFHEKTEVYHLTHGRVIVVMDEDVDDIVVRAMAKQIKDSYKNTTTIGGIEIVYRMNVCVCSFPNDISDTDTLLHFIEDLSRGEPVDEVTYAKDVFSRSKYDILSEIDDILDEAIREKMFEVYYQPIYAIEEDGFKSAEALIRLNHERYGFIPPDLFIPAAEKSGAILDIGKIVLEEVCRFVSSEEYRTLGLHYVEVNLSVIQCMEESLVKEILDTFDKYHIDSGDINLEITETAVSNAQQIMDNNINALFERGVCFSLDDFGTGYSNIHRIASLPLSIIKIDKTLVDDSMKESMKIVIENTVKMIKALGMKIVVEGVETEQQLDQFVTLRCDYIQGYYFSKPLPKNEFVAFMQERIK